MSFWSPACATSARPGTMMIDWQPSLARDVSQLTRPRGGSGELG